MDERHQTLGKVQLDFPPVLTLKRAPIPEQRDEPDLTGFHNTTTVVLAFPK